MGKPLRVAACGAQVERPEGKVIPTWFQVTETGGVGGVSHVLHSVCSAKKGFQGLCRRDLRGEVALVTWWFGMVSQTNVAGGGERESGRVGGCGNSDRRGRKQVQHLCCLPHAFLLGLFSSYLSRLPPWKVGDGFSSCVTSAGMSAALLWSRLLVSPAAYLSPFACSMSISDWFVPKTEFLVPLHLTALLLLLLMFLLLVQPFII